MLNFSTIDIAIFDATLAHFEFFFSFDDIYGYVAIDSHKHVATVSYKSGDDLMTSVTTFDIPIEFFNALEMVQLNEIPQHMENYARNAVCAALPHYLT